MQADYKSSTGRSRDIPTDHTTSTEAEEATSDSPGPHSAVGATGGSELHNIANNSFSGNPDISNRNGADPSPTIAGDSAYVSNTQTESSGKVNTEAADGPTYSDQTSTPMFDATTDNNGKGGLAPSTNALDSNTKNVPDAQTGSSAPASPATPPAADSNVQQKRRRKKGKKQRKRDATAAQANLGSNVGTPPSTAPKASAAAQKPSGSGTGKIAAAAQKPSSSSNEQTSAAAQKSGSSGSDDTSAAAQRPATSSNAGLDATNRVQPQTAAAVAAQQSNASLQHAQSPIRKRGLQEHNTSNQSTPDEYIRRSCKANHAAAEAQPAGAHSPSRFVKSQLFSRDLCRAASFLHPTPPNPPNGYTVAVTTFFKTAVSSSQATDAALTKLCNLNNELYENSKSYCTSPSSPSPHSGAVFLVVSIRS